MRDEYPYISTATCFNIAPDEPLHALDNAARCSLRRCIRGKPSIRRVDLKKSIWYV